VEKNNRNKKKLKKKQLLNKQTHEEDENTDVIPECLGQNEKSCIITMIHERFFLDLFLREQ